MRWDIAIDLGTQSVRVTDYRQGAALETAARLAFQEGREAPICAGDAAARIEGKTCRGVQVVSPLKDGVLENNFYADRMLRYLYHQSELTGGKRFGAMITCAPFARPVQQDALLTAALDAGAQEAALVRSDAAAAIGAGLDFFAPEAKLLVDVGAGKITATVFSMGRVVAFEHLPYGLSRIDERIQRGIRNGGHRIGLSSAREIKHTLGTALPESASLDVIMHMTGFNMESRLPVTFDVETKPVLHACEEVIGEIAAMCVNVVTEIPDDLAADLIDSGVVLVGAGAEMTKLDKRIGDTLGISCRIADSPARCAARGLFAIMQQPEKYSACIMEHSRRRSAR